MVFQVTGPGILTLHRKGYFKVPKLAHNQCKSPGWRDFAYKVEVRALEVLDHHGFIIDHNAIHVEIEPACSDSGSCEEFCIKIARAVKAKCDAHGTAVLGLKVSVRAHDPKRPARSETYSWMVYEVDYPEVKGTKLRRVK